MRRFCCCCLPGQQKQQENTQELLQTRSNNQTPNLQKIQVGQPELMNNNFSSSKPSRTVLVTGANGYIGRAVAIAFRRLGYQVFGLVRSKEKAEEAELKQNEIIPVVGDPYNPQSFLMQLKQSGIIVECASSTDKPDLIKNLIAAVINSGSCEDNQRKLYIQTTGFQQYVHENLVLKNNQIFGCVVRPAFVFGGQGGILQKNILFAKHKDGVFKTGINKSNVWPWVQLNDLAKAYTLIAAKKTQVGGQLFRIGELNQDITFEKVAWAAARAMQVNVEFTNVPEGIENFLNVNITEFNNSTAKFIQWQPSFACNPILDMEIQYKCYLSWIGQFTIQNKFNSQKISKTVLVTGANGYIGRAVALAFKKQGFKVFGLVRNKEKVQEAQLIQNEIIPVIGDPNNPSSFSQYINQSGIIVECASSNDKPDLINNLVDAVSKSGVCEDNTQKIYIQTTGFQQYAHEGLVTQNKSIIGCIVRPAFVFGGSGGPLQRNVLFVKPQDGVLKTGIKKSNYWPWVQLNDLAMAYTQIAVQKTQVQGQVFKVGQLDKSITYEKVATAAAQAMNVDIEFTDQPQGFEQYINISIPEFENSNTQFILQWQPNFPCNPVLDMDIQYQCYCSWQGQQGQSHSQQIFNSQKISKTVLITGANGYIGRSCALAFRKLGYQVFGVVRTEEKANEAQLVQNEIIPVIADPNNPQSFADKIKISGIIIECASSTDKPDLIQNLLEAVVNSGKCEDDSKKLFIQTTGFQQYAHEHLVLQNQQIIGAVVRPAFVYGGQGGPIQRWFLFNKSQDGQLKTGIGMNCIWPWVHIQDLAKAYTLIAQKKNQVTGQLFRVGELDFNITYEKVAQASGQAMNVPVEFVNEQQDMEKFLSISIEEFDNQSTKQLIKWVPEFPTNPLYDMELQYQCFLSWQK